MIVLVTGASHTGKTLLAQKLLEKYGFPYLSIDHLKMGLIRSGYTNLTPKDDSQLEEYLWPILREIIKTAIENKQNLVIEGSYIPFGWDKSFSQSYLKEIRYYCLVMSKQYIEEHFSDVKNHACEIEKRKDDSWCTKEHLLAENAHYLNLCQHYGYPYLLIDGNYQEEVNL